MILSDVDENLGIIKLRKCKRRLIKLYKLISQYNDFELNMIDSDTLRQMSLVSDIDYLLTDVIHFIIDNGIALK